MSYQHGFSQQIFFNNITPWVTNVAKANLIAVTYPSLPGQLTAFQIQALQTSITDWLTHFKANEFMKNHQ